MRGCSTCDIPHTAFYQLCFIVYMHINLFFLLSAYTNFLFERLTDECTASVYFNELGFLLSAAWVLRHREVFLQLPTHSPWIQGWDNSGGSSSQILLPSHRSPLLHFFFNPLSTCLFSKPILKHSPATFGSACQGVHLPLPTQGFREKQL